MNQRQDQPNATGGEYPQGMEAERRPSIDAGLATIIGSMTLFWILLSLASYFLVVEPRGQRFDFYPLWRGSRAVLRGESPYSDEMTWQIQEEMFGHRVVPGQDEQHFVYSATITWILLPFWLLPFSLAASLWLGLQLLLLLVLPLWVASNLNWKIRLWALFLLLIFSLVIFRYPINSYLIGQFVPFGLACIVAVWWGLIHDRWIVTSLALTLAMVRPDIVIVPIIAILLVVWEEGERRIMAAWLSGMASLWVLTRIMIGPWELDFMRRIQGYQSYSSLVWPPDLIGSSWLALIFISMVGAWGVWMWRELRVVENAERLGWLISIAFLVSLLVFPQSGNYTLILSLVPVWLIIWSSRGKHTYWITMFLILSSPWLFHFSQYIPADSEHLIIPLAIAIVLSFSWLSHTGRMIRKGYTNV